MTEQRAELGFLSRATLVSLGATGLEFVILPFTGKVMPKWVAFASVQIVANLVTFLAYKYWAFEAAKVGSLGRQYVRQTVVFGGSWLFNTVLPTFLSDHFAWGLVVPFAISNVFVYLLWNYPLNRWWVFHELAPQPSAT